MASQIQFLNKNFIDLSYLNVNISVTDTTAINNGTSFVDYLRNRKNTSAWVTTGSNDAANTTLEVFWGTVREVDRILLIGHNFKSYTIQYYSGGIYNDFSTPIATTENEKGTTSYSFDAVLTNKIKIIITGTITPDDDKILRQLIVTKSIGSFKGWPIIKKPEVSNNKTVSRSLSGKVFVSEAVGAFSCRLQITNLKDDDDLTLIESIYDKNEGVLVWLCGGDEAQFSSVRKGYRLEDIYFMRPVDEYTPEFYKGLYATGIKFDMKLEESIL